MTFALATALKDLRRRLADPMGLIVWLIVPLALGGMMRLIFGGGSPDITAHVFVVDQDKSVVSQFLMSAAGRAGSILKLEDVSLDDGTRRIGNGEATALVIIPKGFQDAVLNETPAEITLVTNPSQRLLPSIVEEGLRMLSLAAFYVQRLFGEPLRQIAATAQSGNRGPTDAMVSGISIQINQRINSLQTSLLPPVMTVEVKTDAQAEQPVNFGNLFLPGLLFMSLLFAAQTIGGDIWIEHERGTLRRALTMPQPLGSFLVGKMIAGVAVMALLVSVALALGVVAFGVSIARVPLALLWTCFAGFALLTLLGCLQVFAKTARGGGMLTTMIIFPLMMIGGSFFPFEIMPAWMQRVGRWTPNGLAVARLKEILFGTIDFRALGVAALAIGAASVVAFVIGNWQTRRRFRTN